MRLSVALLGISLLGVLAGGWLTGRVGFGLCVIADSVILGAWALFHDDDRKEPAQEPQALTVAEILRKAERALD